MGSPLPLGALAGTNQQRELKPPKADMSGFQGAGGYERWSEANRAAGGTGDRAAFDQQMGGGAQTREAQPANNQPAPPANNNQGNRTWDPNAPVSQTNQPLRVQPGDPPPPAWDPNAPISQTNQPRPTQPPAWPNWQPPTPPGFPTGFPMPPGANAAQNFAQPMPCAGNLFNAVGPGFANMLGGSGFFGR